MMATPARPTGPPRKSSRSGAARSVWGAGPSRASTSVLKSKLKVWVVFDGRVKFGDGRAQLLERVDALGSLRQAVTGMGMSYRAAWGYLRELERAGGFKRPLMSVLRVA